MEDSDTTAMLGRLEQEGPMRTPGESCICLAETPGGSSQTRRPGLLCCRFGESVSVAGWVWERPCLMQAGPGGQVTLSANGLSKGQGRKAGSGGRWEHLVYLGPKREWCHGGGLNAQLGADGLHTQEERTFLCWILEQVMKALCFRKDRGLRVCQADWPKWMVMRGSPES